MMNLSMAHPVPTFGDSFTITCYVCGMPSSREWAQKTRSRPTTPMKPYFPFLLQISPITGAMLREDGSTFLCAFCHASLEAQWHVYESQQVVPPPNRKYHIQKFICAVCGVETYRKRIRALPFQEFPFLEKQRQPGSITLGNNPLAIVCLDCSETLWAQSAEYDRWGLPVHKRHFNWMARPPPPEDSVEATVARLPSGETQLPRCPPIEPATPPTSKQMETMVSMKVRGKGKGDSPKMEAHLPPSSTPQSIRKSSLTSTTPPSVDMIAGFHNQQPPIVTVAPMSSHTTVINTRKETLSLPPGLMAPTAHASSTGLYSQSAVFSPAAAYSPYVWGNQTSGAREASQRSMEAYPYVGPPPETIAGANAWPWLSHSSQDLLRYQSYMSSLQSRTPAAESFYVNRLNESAAAASSSPPHPAPPIHYAPGMHQPSSSSISRDRDHEDRPHISSNRGRAAGAGNQEAAYPPHPPVKGSPELRPGKRSPKQATLTHSRDSAERSPSGTPYPTHPKKLPKESSPRVNARHHESSAKTGENKGDTSLSSSSTLPHPARASHSQSVPVSTATETEQEKHARTREHHIPKKRNWHVFMKESQNQEEKEAERSSELPSCPKKKLTSAYNASKDGGSHSRNGRTPPRDSSTAGSSSQSRRRSAESAIDLSVVPDPQKVVPSQNQALKKGSGARFNIEYLCQSEAKSGSAADADSTARTSVIKCAPKIPSEVVPSQTVKVEEDEETEEDDPMNGSELTEQKEEATLKREGGDEGQVSGSGPPEETSDKEGGGSDDSERVVVKDSSKQASCSSDEETQRPRSRTETHGEDAERMKEGNSESTQDACTILDLDDDVAVDDDDDDERKNEDLRNVEQFLKETITDLVNREKEQQKMRQETVDKQKQFLNNLGLITPDKKIEVEISKIVRRHDKKTLPPLKLRAAEKQLRTNKISKQLKDMLVKVALQDPNLFQETQDTHKSDFMAELGMKTARKSDKAKREVKWRVILMERVRRELRDSAARGIKHEWEDSDVLREFASCDLESFFNSLTVTYDDDEKPPPNSKGNEEKCSDTELKRERVDDDRIKSASAVCINYPKYIPSYVTVCSSRSSDTSDDNSSGIPPRCEAQMATRIQPEKMPLNIAETILKIPVIPSKKRHPLSESSSVATAGASDTDDSDLGLAPEDNKTSQQDASTSKPQQTNVDNLIQASVQNWQNVKQTFDEIMDKLTNSKDSFEEKMNHVHAIRSHLKCQSVDLKEMEKRLRAASKSIQTASRKRNQNKE